MAVISVSLINEPSASLITRGGRNSKIPLKAMLCHQPRECQINFPGKIFARVIRFSILLRVSQMKGKGKATASATAAHLPPAAFEYLIRSLERKIAMMKISKSVITFLCLTLLLPATSLPAFGQARTGKKPANAASNDDITIRVRTTMEGQSQGFESTQYVKGSRERNEMNIGMGMASITQCDLQRTIQINDKARTYMVQAMNDNSVNEPAANPNRGSAPAPQSRRGGIVSYVNTITDTGERKEMFGFTARHLKTSMTSESSPDACNQEKMRMESDGWYIDLNYSLDCQNQAAMAQSHSDGGGQCRDQYRFKNVGSGKLGFALDVTTTIYGADGRKTVMKREVIELSRSPLDSALFEAPAGYTEVKDYQQLMGIPSHGRSSRDGEAPAPAGNDKAANSNRTAATSETGSQSTERKGVPSLRSKGKSLGIWH